VEKWIASKRRKREEEQEDEKLMDVYNLRFFLWKVSFIFFMIDFFQFCFLWKISFRLLLLFLI
jgi:hypothetical protein